MSSKNSSNFIRIHENLMNIFFFQNKMPAQANGSGKTGVLEMKDGETFLFTSESVGEGHPGLYIFCPLLSRCFSSRCTSYDFCSLTQDKCTNNRCCVSIFVLFSFLTFAFYFWKFGSIWKLLTHQLWSFFFSVQFLKHFPVMYSITVGSLTEFLTYIT